MGIINSEAFHGHVFNGILLSGQITNLIHGVQQGDSSSANALWEHYFPQVLRLAQKKMFMIQGAYYDEEDAALSALHSLFRGLKNGRFPQLEDRDNLWRMLVLITERKIRHQWRKEKTLSRSPAGREKNEPVLDVLLAEEPTPEFVCMMMEEFERLLDVLVDDRLKKIAVMKMDGFTQEEIAHRIDCASRTVRRKMDRIREIWTSQDWSKC